MTPSRDTTLAFDKIAGEVEPLFARLGRAAPGAELDTVRDEITGLLDGAGLCWSDVAARMAAPSPGRAAVSADSPPPPMLPPLTSTTGSIPDGSRVLTNAELQSYGYRTPPGQADFGYEPPPKPTED